MKHTAPTKPFLPPFRPPEPDDALQAHFRAVEAYIAGEDPATVLLRRLERKVARGEHASMSQAERVYFSVNTLYGALINGCARWFFDEHPEEIWAAADEGFRELDCGGMHAAFVALRQRHLDGELAEYDGDDEELDFLIGPLIHHQLEMNARIDDYAVEHGIWPG